MLDAKDIQLFREMLVEQDVRIEQRLDKKFSVFRDEIVTTMTTKFRTELQKELHKELYKVRNDIIDVINGVLPQVDGLDRRVTRLERWARMT